MNDVHDVQQFNEESDYMGESFYAPLLEHLLCLSKRSYFCILVFGTRTKSSVMYFCAHGLDCLLI